MMYDQKWFCQYVRSPLIGYCCSRITINKIITIIRTLSTEMQQSDWLVTMV